MYKHFYWIIIVAVFVVALIYVAAKRGSKEAVVPPPNANNVSAAAPSSSSGSDKIYPPISDARSRITKKPFGIYITPQNSPVQPERFHGYHTGTDFETFPAEQNVDVPIYAACAGKLLRKDYESGYG